MTLVNDPAAIDADLRAGRVGGFALDGDQPASVAARISGAVAAAAVGTPGIPPVVASDEEGGPVQRLRAALGAAPSAADVAATMDPAQAGRRFADYAVRARRLGVTMILGPVIDVGVGAGLARRTYGDSPDAVASYGLAVAQASASAGVTPVVKHWPGLGRSRTDTHDAPTVLPLIDVLRTSDLVPFQRAIRAGLPAVMVSHATVTGLTDGPASLSRQAITGELRQRQGFDGVVITDSLTMGAVRARATQPEAAELAIAAGADLALIAGAADVAPTHRRLVEAQRAGRLDPAQVERSVARVLALKGLTGCPV